ncbi:pyrrolo-quinoline quinone [Natrinema mahii]|nr:pyrrolo-quinoline quinone [Natrinema mahii]
MNSKLSNQSVTTTTQEEATMASSGDSDRDDIIKEIERVSTKLGKRPTTTEFSEHSKYKTSDVYSHFDSWGDAVDAASIETASRQELLDELQQLKSELGFIPLSTHVDEHSSFSTYDYRLVFGSVDDALEEAGYDLEERVIELVEQAVSDSDGKPKMANFEAIAPYSAGVIYKFFDGWDEAVAAAKSGGTETTLGADSDRDTAEVDTTVEQNELSERYETLRNLRELCRVVIDARDKRTTDEKQEDRYEPMDQWAEVIESRWSGDSVEAENYGEQQNTRNQFSMREYRREYGNGDRVLEFGCISARPPSLTMQALLEPFLDVDPGEFYLPVDPVSDTTLPIIVESEYELDHAVEMLQRLPTEPTAAEHPGEQSTEKDSSEMDAKPGDILEVNGVTDEIATVLQTNGYLSREDLKNASMEELANVDGVGEQIAMRIKLDVGG